MRERTGRASNKTRAGKQVLGKRRKSTLQILLPFPSARLLSFVFPSAAEEHASEKSAFSERDTQHRSWALSSLDVLLSNLGARKLIITGFAADICVLFTANDASMRDYELIVPCRLRGLRNRGGAARFLPPKSIRQRYFFASD